MRRLRGAGISMILHGPKYSLNPVMTAGRQIAETFLVHHKTSRHEPTHAYTRQLFQAAQVTAGASSRALRTICGGR